MLLKRETSGVAVGLTTGERVGPEDQDGAYDVVAVAASLGGIEVLSSILAGLPVNFPLPILVVQHLLKNRPSFLPGVLARHTSLHVQAARDGERPSPGRVYVAPPNWHLVVRADGALGLVGGAAVNFCRPSADVLFRSVARVFGSRAIAVVLSGMGRDGARGVEAIAEADGATIAQDPATAEAADMPRAAVEIGHADLVLPPDRIGIALKVLAGQPRPGASLGPRLLAETLTPWARAEDLNGPRAPAHPPESPSEASDPAGRATPGAAGTKA